MSLLVRADGVTRALPYWSSLCLVPIVLWAAASGGWALLLPPLASWGLFAVLDRLLGEDRSQAGTAPLGIGWHLALVRLWVPVQFATLFGLIAAHGRLDLSGPELALLFFGTGILTGTVGITYAHELIHRPGRADRRLGDLLLATVLYSHFRTEHLLVHHVHVATPLDPATAREGESFWRYFLRVLPGSLASALACEARRQARRGRPARHLSNPFWLYAALQGGCLGLAFALGGTAGLLLFVWQALAAVWQLELVNYVEHYGLTRERLPDGRYEPVGPQHSWNAAQKASNWLLINLQRHSDHHVAPMRPYPLLRNRPEAPSLPHGYPVMTVLALVPPLWHARMRPRLRAWQRRHDPAH
ncbi:alkane 1-monooxygenase [Mangrovicoccus sp. HB161399]|uniref:alkane 1-monooxygenase n=1 Tax=Mangrovicoccus sp. HB161399 TaxID=2720392 RepID=UPI00155370E2|nr:alkane 1-monooxygenase [Mangrovicoccus sp. HB161399]